VLIALWSAGSLAGGLFVTRRSAPPDLARRARTLLLALALLEAPLVLTGRPLLLAVLLTIAGVPVAPLLACTFGLLERVAPPGTVTEGYGWLTAGITAGAAAGAALSGVLAQGAGLHAAMAIAAVTALAGAAAARALRAPT
jgi:predicted MFS family arabinose efflux permease